MEGITTKDSNRITREYFDRLLLEMRHIDGVKPDTAVDLFGEKFSMPIATAALSHLNDTCERGMAKMAEGVRDTLLKMNGELKGVMARTGFAEVPAIDSSVIWKTGI